MKTLPIRRIQKRNLTRRPYLPHPSYMGTNLDDPERFRVGTDAVPVQQFIWRPLPFLTNRRSSLYWSWSLTEIKETSRKLNTFFYSYKIFNWANILRCYPKSCLCPKASPKSGLRYPPDCWESGHYPDCWESTHCPDCTMSQTDKTGIENDNTGWLK